MMFDNAPPQIEPTYDQRIAAMQMRGTYEALLRAGFDEQQAMYLLGEMVKRK